MSVILFLAILLVLVLVHEFGHFFVAKKSGIRVDEFAFGFPPRLFSIKKGETTYAFNALPLGGYVKIYGENPDDVTDVDRTRSFAAQHRFKQGAVVIAGIVSNLILAWIFISATFMIGIPASETSAAPYKITTPKLMIIELSPTDPAAMAGLEVGDILVSIADQTESVLASSPEVVSGFIGAREGQSLTVTYVRNKAERHLSVTPVAGIVSERAAIGIYMDMIGTLKLSFFEAVKNGAVKTYEYTALTAVGILGFLKNIFIGHADLTQVAGPVGMVGAVGTAAGLGLAHLLLFTALISINLAVINVLPFPALDGGRLLFIVIEGIMRRPIKPIVANILNLAGFALLMVLMLVVTWHDITNLFR